MTVVNEARGAAARGHTGVRYIGRETPFLDRLYDSHLTFDPGQVRHVPQVLADRLLRHSDCFESVSEEAAESAEVTVKVDDTELQLKEAEANKAAQQVLSNQRQDVVDQVNTMDKDALKNFAQDKYGQPVDARKSVEALRQQVVGMIDAYGIV